MTVPLNIHVEARRRMSGIEFFRKMLAGEMPPPPMLDLLGIRLAEVAEGRVVFTATCQEQFYNGTGVAHGGFAATLLDTALGCAINSAMPAGRRFTTLELKVNLTRPITTEAGRWRGRPPIVTSAGGRRRRKAASSTPTASSTLTVRRPASSSTRRGERSSPKAVSDACPRLRPGAPDLSAVTPFSTPL